MKIKPEKAVASVIAYKQQLDKQLSFEQEQMFSMVKKRSGIYAKILANIAKINGVELNKKELRDIKTKSDEIFKSSLTYFRKIKRLALKKPGSTLSGIANPHNIPGRNDGPTPAPQPEPEVLQAICFNSAIRCEGNSCDRITATIFPKFESSGEGGPIGIGAASPSSVRGKSNSLYFLYLPVANGAVNILSEIILTGEVIADSGPIFLLNLLIPVRNWNCSASAKLGLELVVWQYDNVNNVPAIYTETKVVMADVYSDDGSFNWVIFNNKLCMLNHSIIVTAGQWVVIEIRAMTQVIGMSSASRALINFGKGTLGNVSNYGIHVQNLCIVPAGPVVVL